MLKFIWCTIVDGPEFPATELFYNYTACKAAVLLKYNVVARQDLRM